MNETVTCDRCNLEILAIHAKQVDLDTRKVYHNRCYTALKFEEMKKGKEV